MASMTASLNARGAVDDAIDRHATQQAQAVSESKRADAELAEIDLAAALETDPARIQALEPKLAAARQAQESAADTVLRLGRLRVSLAEKARELDLQIHSDRTEFQAAAAEYSQQLFAALSIELQEAVKPLVATLEKVHGVTYALGVGAAMVGLLEEVRVPSSVFSEGNIISGSRYRDGKGEIVDLAQTWRDGPDALALVEQMQP